MTVPGEMARVTGLLRPKAGLGNRALVAEGYAIMPARGTYRLAAAVASRGLVEDVEFAVLKPERRGRLFWHQSAG